MTTTGPRVSRSRRRPLAGPLLQALAPLQSSSRDWAAKHGAPR